MKQLQSIDELSILISDFLKKSTCTNSFVLLETYKNFIADRKLYFIQTKENLVFLLEKHDYYQLYFFINNFNQSITLPNNRPIVMEILYKGLQNEPVDIINYWILNGFNKHLTRDNFINVFNEVEIPVYRKCSTNITFAKNDREVIFAQSLFEKLLDRFTGDLLTFDELKVFCTHNNLLCAYYEGELAGALQFEVKNSVVWLGHIAVEEKFRGMGIANELVKSYLNKNKTENNTRYALWVRRENVGAINLYSKFGFKYGGKSTVSMLKTK